MNFKERLALYDNELDRMLIDSFEPYASMQKENKEARKECEEHFKTRFNMTSLEFAQEMGKPF